jgi:hypothetical protein
MAARLRFALVSLVVTRWSKDLLVMFVMFGSACTDTDDYGISQKKKSETSHIPRY